jgi:hypothetical protein
MTAFSIGVHGSSANRPGSVMASRLLNGIRILAY